MKIIDELDSCRNELCLNDVFIINEAIGYISASGHKTGEELAFRLRKVLSKLYYIITKLEQEYIAQSVKEFKNEKED